MAAGQRCAVWCWHEGTAPWRRMQYNLLPTMIEIDETRFPLVLVHWSGTVSDDDLQQFFRDMDAFGGRAAAARQHYALVSAGEVPLRPTQRQLIASWLSHQSPELARWDLGSHIVIRNVVARGVFTAITWLVPTFTRTHVYSTLEDALSAAESKLRAVASSRV